MKCFFYKGHLSLSTISALTQIMGSGVSGFGQYQQGQNQQAAYDYNANIALDIAYELWVIENQKKAHGDTGMWHTKPSKRRKGFYDRKEV